MDLHQGCSQQCEPHQAKLHTLACSHMWLLNTSTRVIGYLFWLSHYQQSQGMHCVHDCLLWCAVMLLWLRYPTWCSTVQVYACMLKILRRRSGWPR